MKRNDYNKFLGSSGEGVLELEVEKRARNIRDGGWIVEYLKLRL